MLRVCTGAHVSLCNCVCIPVLCCLSKCPSDAGLAAMCPCESKDTLILCAKTEIEIPLFVVCLSLIFSLSPAHLQALKNHHHY